MLKLKRFIPVAIALIILAFVYGFQGTPPGFISSTFFGTPVIVPTLTTYETNWEAVVMNQSILSLDNQGLNSPAAIVNAAAIVAQDYCDATVDDPVPECATATTISAVVAPVQKTLLAAANDVPQGQWGAATWNPQAAFNLNSAVQLAAANVPPPPAPANQPLVLLPCYPTGVPGMAARCDPGPGSTLVSPAPANLMTITDGEVVSQGGVQYTAHISNGLMGQTLYFTVGANTSLRYRR